MAETMQPEHGTTERVADPLVEQVQFPFLELLRRYWRLALALLGLIAAAIIAWGVNEARMAHVARQFRAEIAGLPQRMRNAAAQFPEEDWDKLIPSERELRQLEKEYGTRRSTKFQNWIERYYRNNPDGFFTPRELRMQLLDAMALRRCRQGDCVGALRIVGILMRNGSMGTACAILDDLELEGCCSDEALEPYFERCEAPPKEEDYHFF